MPNTKHTSAPWGLAVALSRDSNTIRYVVSGPYCQNICELNHSADMKQDEALANARLIVAAPDLLFWLEKLIGHVAHYATIPHSHSDAHKDVAMARSVIAKVNGPQLCEKG